MIDQRKLYEEQMAIVNPTFSTPDKRVDDSIVEDLTTYDHNHAVNYSKSDETTTSTSRL